jgi:ribosomal protein S18 acetylase RimI-like enzyme
MLEPILGTDLRIEGAQTRDAAELASLLRAAYAEHGAAGLNFSAATTTEARVLRRIATRDVYVLHRANRLIGTITLRTKQDEHGPHGYVNSLAVDPQLKGTGLGRLLLERAEQEAVKRGFSRMRLDTAKPATDLVGWYERRGYRAVTEVHWDGKTYDSVVMEKVLR